MRQITVLLDFGATGRHHSLYDELLQAPPDKVGYVVPSIPKETIPGPALAAYKFVRKNFFPPLDSLARRLNRMRAAGYDVVHYANNIDESGCPFVADFEHALSFLPRYPRSPREAWIPQARKRMLKVLESRHCKCLMPWTKEGAKSLWQAFPSESVETKTRTVHLAMRIPQAHKPIPHEGFRVLFLGTMNLSGPWNFYYRGGRRLLRVFGRFAKGKGDAQLLLTGEVPEQEEGLLSKTPNAKAVGILPKQELGLLFRTCDALLFPSYCTPGLAFLEAMRYHLPVITTDAWANRELVENGRNGLVSEFTRFDTHGTFNILPHNDDFTAFEKNQIDGRLEDSLVESLERLYCDRRLARLMGERGFGMVGSGRFCIERRNRELRKIYDGCL